MLIANGFYIHLSSLLSCFIDGIIVVHNFVLYTGKLYSWRIILQRISVNIVVIGLLAASGYTVVSAVGRFVYKLIYYSTNTNKITLSYCISLVVCWMTRLMDMFVFVNRSETISSNASWIRRNEVNVIMTLLSFVLPMIFDALGLFENWHPRQQLRLQLARYVFKVIFGLRVLIKHFFLVFAVSSLVM